MFLNPSNCLPHFTKLPTFQSDMGARVRDANGRGPIVEVYNSQRSGYSVHIRSLLICLEVYYSTREFMRGGCTYAEWFAARRACCAIRRGKWVSAPGVRVIGSVDDPIH